MADSAGLLVDHVGMLKNILSDYGEDQLFNEFLQVDLSLPFLLHAHARHMRNARPDRLFVHQNADDAGAAEVCLPPKKKELLYKNNGPPVTRCLVFLAAVV
jgi:hypothetical protein